jgi:hypothetical protein
MCVRIQANGKMRVLRREISTLIHCGDCMPHDSMPLKIRCVCGHGLLMWLMFLVRYCCFDDVAAVTRKR